MPESANSAVTDLTPIVKDSEVLVSQVSPVLFAAVGFILIMINHAFFTELVSFLHTRVTKPLLDANRRLLARPALYFGVLILISSHLVEICIWGYALVWAGFVAGIGEALYFSGSTYTTLGYGNDILPGATNSITAVIALSGMFSIAWTTSSLMGMIQHMLSGKNKGGS
jgi:voltage-gated potassium channel Kch